jgi:hypothetical protein
VRLYGRWDTREQRRVELFKDKVKIGQVGDADTLIVTVSEIATRNFWPVIAYSFVGSVPSCATMTVFSDGEYPTYPMEAREHLFVMISIGVCLQNCVASPSPPEATGLKSGFAWQWATEVRVSTSGVLYGLKSCSYARGPSGNKYVLDRARNVQHRVRYPRWNQETSGGIYWRERTTRDVPPQVQLIINEGSQYAPPAK